MPTAPDFQTWLEYPDGVPFPLGTKIRIRSDSPLHPRCYGYVRSYDVLGRALVEVPHVGQYAPQPCEIKHLSLYKDPYGRA